MSIPQTLLGSNASSDVFPISERYQKLGVPGWSILFGDHRHNHWVRNLQTQGKGVPEVININI